MSARTAAGRSSNNFDLLRILAALQVAIVHACSHFALDGGIVLRAIEAVPGVPIFFVISGYLVSQSYQRTTLRDYARNRALRIFPGLWVCLVVSIALAAIIGHVSFARPETFGWVAAQLTVVQFYNPDFLRGFGTGALNGSLWTIPVELEFYVLLPILWMIIGKRRPVPWLIVIAVLGAIASLLTAATYSEAVWHKLLRVTLIPYLYMFVLGMLLEQTRELRQRFVIGHAMWWVAAFAAWSIATRYLGWKSDALIVDPVTAVLIAGAVIALAFARPVGLRGFDLSYGLYIYHMPVINSFLALGFAWTYLTAAAAVGASLLLALLSWLFVEKPALSLKSRPQPRTASVPHW